MNSPPLSYRRESVTLKGMTNSPDSDGDGAPEPDPRRADLTDSEVDEAFAHLAHRFIEDSLPGPRDYVAAEETEGFVPPDPGPVSSTDPFLNLGWALLVGGLLIILASLMIWPSAPRAFHLACAAASVIGGAILTWRMPRDRDDHDEDGAVV